MYAMFNISPYTCFSEIASGYFEVPPKLVYGCQISGFHWDSHVGGPSYGEHMKLHYTLVHLDQYCLLRLVMALQSFMEFHPALPWIHYGLNVRPFECKEFSTSPSLNFWMLITFSTNSLLSPIQYWVCTALPPPTDLETEKAMVDFVDGDFVTSTWHTSWILGLGILPTWQPSSQEKMRRSVTDNKVVWPFSETTYLPSVKYNFPWYWVACREALDVTQFML